MTKIVRIVVHIVWKEFIELEGSRRTMLCIRAAAPFF